MSDEQAQAEPITASAQRINPDDVAEGRRRVCLTTGIQLLMHNLLLPWEVVDYAKYLEDYLKYGTVPRDEVLAVKTAPKKAKRKLHS